MTIFNVLTLACGLALFLFGMNTMGDALKKSAGNKLKVTLGKMTSNPFKSFLLGSGVTAIVQSSSATTVMLVGFVNSGTITLAQSVGAIMGANIAASTTYWLTGLSGLGGDVAQSLWFIEWLKPSSWMPILALIGIGLQMFAKRKKSKDVGVILLGFSVLMVGMDIMSGAVSGLKDEPKFAEIFTLFKNPLLGVLAGTAITAIIQSSGASVGILQSLTTTGAITYGMAIPIAMGQNIGTCITALLSAIGANKNGKRVALVHLYFNVLGTIIWLAIYCLVTAIFPFSFLEAKIGMWGVAAVHTVFKILVLIVLAPASRLLVKLAEWSVPDKKNKENETVNLLDERLFATPSVAVVQANTAVQQMTNISIGAMSEAMGLLDNYDPKVAEHVRQMEEEADKFEDVIGSYLVKLSTHPMADRDNEEITKLLRLIGDLERISDHAVNIVESAEEMKEKEIVFSEQANKELQILRGAIGEIMEISCRALVNNDTVEAEKVEPLEEIVDELCEKIKRNHTVRLQKKECNIEHGFVLSDLLTNFERVSDHCSNIAGCIIEIDKNDSLNLHKYLDGLKANGSEEFDRDFNDYHKKYTIN